MKKYLFAIIFIMSAVIMLLIGRNRRISEENSRLQQNITVLHSGMESYRTSLGQSVAQVGQLELTVKELKAYNADLNERLEQMQLKLHRVESLSLNVVTTTVQFSTPLEKALIHPKQHPTRSFKWQDPWSMVKGVVGPDSVQCSIQHNDTLDQVMYRVPKKFLFIKYGTKEIRQVISARDPKSTIVYSEYIVLTRKRKR